MTKLNCSISLKIVKKTFGCVGSCGYAPSSVNRTLTCLETWRIFYIKKKKR